MIKYVLIAEIIYNMIATGGFLFPLLSIYKPKIKIKDLAEIWFGAVFLYLILAHIIVPSMFGKETIIFLSVEIMSVLSIVTIFFWYSFRSIRLNNFYGINLMIHVENIGIIYFITWICECTLKINSLFFQYIPILCAFIIQILITSVNKKIVNALKLMYKKILLMVFTGTILIGIYFYQLVLPSFITESASDFEQGMNGIGRNSLTVFVKTLLIFVVLYTLIAMFVVRAHVLKMRLKEKEIRQQELENYIKTMELLQTDIRKIHHDYKNLIIALGGYLYDEENQIDVDGLRKYYKENVLVQKETELKVINLSKLQNLKILEIKGLLAAKMIQGSQKAIKISIEIQDIIDRISIDALDFTRIVGNLMDNAIEAAAECQNPEIHIAFIKGNKVIIFIIENTISEQHLLDFPQLGISTKGKGRGLGLKNVTEIVDSYSNIYQESDISNGRFQKKIIIYDDSV